MGATELSPEQAVCVSTDTASTVEVECGSVAAYYAYFPDFGIVYLNCIDASKTKASFSPDELSAINEAILEVEQELERLKTIRVRYRSVPMRDGGKSNG
jgi:hypothetical protein